MRNGNLTKHSSELGVDELVEIAEGISYDKCETSVIIIMNENTKVLSSCRYGDQWCILKQIIQCFYLIYFIAKRTREAVSIIVFIVLTVATCNSLYRHLHITNINQVPAIVITCSKY